jgi:hypothetical protein
MKRIRRIFENARCAAPLAPLVVALAAAVIVMIAATGLAACGTTKPHAADVAGVYVNYQRSRELVLDASGTFQTFVKHGLTGPWEPLGFEGHWIWQGDTVTLTNDLGADSDPSIVLPYQYTGGTLIDIRETKDNVFVRQ